MKYFFLVYDSVDCGSVCQCGRAVVIKARARACVCMCVYALAENVINLWIYQAQGVNARLSGSGSARMDAWTYS